MGRRNNPKRRRVTVPAPTKEIKMTTDKPSTTPTTTPITTNPAATKPTTGTSGSAWPISQGSRYGNYAPARPADPLIVCTITDPMNVKLTFAELVRQTCPGRTEAARFGPLMTEMGFTADGQGNWYKAVGENFDTAFTAHLDDVSYTRHNVQIVVDPKTGLVGTDGTTILGADCKAGVAVMLYMIASETPGLYVLFREEETGRIGSEAAAKHGSLPLTGINKMVSFDRRSYNSVITNQSGMQTCSDEFAQEVADELNAFFQWGPTVKPWAPDPTGSYTDSYSFADLIPECTNLSVGYHNAHMKTECIDLDFLTHLAEVCSMIEWGDFSVVRDPTVIDTGLLELFSEAARRYGGTLVGRDFREAVYSDPDLAAAVLAGLCNALPGKAIGIIKQVEAREAAILKVYNPTKKGYSGGSGSYGGHVSTYSGKSNLLDDIDDITDLYDDEDHIYGVNANHPAFVKMRDEGLDEEVDDDEEGTPELDEGAQAAQDDLEQRLRHVLDS